MGEAFLWRFERKPFVIVLVEGGLASQITRATLGKMFEEKGFNVKYQTEFYKSQGYDLFHVERRDYILDKCFSDVQIDVASPKEIEKYKNFYDYESNKHGRIKSIEEWNVKRPIYLSGYSSDFLMDFNRCPDFFDIEKIKNILGINARKIYTLLEINRQNKVLNVGVHVRRGDMVQLGYYWDVPTGKYFVEAINKVKDENTNRDICFFFFSNGFDFVESEILPQIDNIDVILVDNNEFEYEDFYLLCQCDVQVESQGTWGPLAYICNKNPGKRYVTFREVSDDENAIIIKLSDDMHL